MISHYQHPCKCMNCGLHFVVLSWKENWPEAGDGWTSSLDPVCPECGSDVLLRWEPLKLDKQIFEVVPGGQLPLSMGPIGGA